MDRTWFVLTDLPEGSGGPRFSPDGSKIVFSSTPSAAGKYPQIYIMDADGSSITRLGNPSATNITPVFSPDGRKIVFASEYQENYQIYIINTDGSNPTRLTNPPWVNFFPSYSPDGRKIAFVSNSDGLFQIYIMNADGSTLPG